MLQLAKFNILDILAFRFARRIFVKLIFAVGQAMIISLL